MEMQGGFTNLSKLRSLLGNHPNVLDMLKTNWGKNLKHLFPTNVGKLGEAPTNHLRNTILYKTNGGIPVHGLGSSQRVETMSRWLRFAPSICGNSETETYLPNDNLQPHARKYNNASPGFNKNPRWSQTHFPLQNTCCLYYRKCKHWDIFHLLGWISWTC